jgi:HPt (histidine-containing phosphotransfer) domain-containing protein
MSTDFKFELMDLEVKYTGEITSNNLTEFREMARQAIAKINRELETDEEFGQAALDVKALKTAEDSVRAAALRMMDEKVQSVIGELNEVAEEFRVPRLEIEKMITVRRDEVKAKIVTTHLERFDIMPSIADKHYKAGLMQALVGKRTLESMDTACRIYQTTAQAGITKSRESIDRFLGKFSSDLVPDRDELELKPVDAVEAELVRRVQAQKAEAEKRVLEEQLAAAKAKEKAALVATQKPLADVKAPITDTIKMDAVADKWDDDKTAPLTADEEWSIFRKQCLAAFGPLKDARAKLLHVKNASRATIFANAINKIWMEEMQ